MMAGCGDAASAPRAANGSVTIPQARASRSPARSSSESAVAVPEVLTNTTRTSRMASSSGSPRRSRAHRASPVHTGGVPWSPASSGVPGSGASAGSPSTSIIAPNRPGAPTATRAGTSSPPSCRHTTPSVVKRIGAHTTRRALHAGRASRIDPPGPSAGAARGGTSEAVSSATFRTTVEGVAVPTAGGSAPSTAATSTPMGTIVRTARRIREEGMSSADCAPAGSRCPRSRAARMRRPERNQLPERVTRPRRSCLSVPGSSPKMLAKAPSLPADEVFMDLEDSVAPLAKEEARGNVVQALKEGDWTGKIVVVRVNGVYTKWCAGDIQEVVGTAGGYLDCVMVPKVETASDVTFVDNLLRMIEETTGLDRRIGIEVQIETATGLRYLDGFRETALRARALGYDGKWALHPGQVDVLNEVFTPTQDEFDKADAVLEAYRHATDVEGVGAVMFGNEMIDEASRKMAEQLAARGRAAGLEVRKTWAEFRAEWEGT